MAGGWSCSAIGIPPLTHPVVVTTVERLPTTPRQVPPPPPMQDLHPDTVHVGLPPGRKLSLSHGWFTEMHPDPSGSKMARLAATLIELDADDELDGVFIDYCSCVHVQGIKPTTQGYLTPLLAHMAWQCRRRRLRRCPKLTSRRPMRQSPCKTGRRRKGSSSVSQCGRVRVPTA